MRRLWLLAALLAAMVAGFELGVHWARVAAPARPPVATQPGHGGQGPKSKTKPGKGGSPSGASATPEGRGTTQPVQEVGGVVAPVYAFFADLGRGEDEAAYQEMAASWREDHPFPAFVASLPQRAPVLLAVSVLSVGNFTADVRVTVAGAAGAAAVVVPLVNEAGPPGAAASGVDWRLNGWPLP